MDDTRVEMLLWAAQFAQLFEALPLPREETQELARMVLAMLEEEPE